METRTVTRRLLRAEQVASILDVKPFRVYELPDAGALYSARARAAGPVNDCPLDIQAVYSSLLEQGLSARTVRYAHSVLRMALEQAVRWGMIQRNPAQ